MLKFYISIYYRKKNLPVSKFGMICVFCTSIIHNSDYKVDFSRNDICHL